MLKVYSNIPLAQRIYMSWLFKHNQAVATALHTLIFLTHAWPSSATKRRIANHYGTSAAHLAVLVKKLKDAKLITTCRGQRGGLKLARRPETISILEVIEAASGKLNVDQCPYSTPYCAGLNCVLGLFMASSGEDVRGFFESTSLTQLVKSATRSRSRLFTFAERPQSRP